ncbi:mpv17-like protein [Glandiceps talaboti]
MNNIHRIARSSLFRNSVFVGVSFAATEYIQQSFMSDDYDVPKIKRLTFWGLCFSGPMSYGFYRAVDHLFPGTKALTIAKKLAIEIGIGFPIYLTGFYTVQSILEGKSDIFADWKEKFVPTYIAGSAVSVPIEGLNFLLIPPAYRVVYMGTMNIVWVNMLCFINRMSFREKE